MVKILRTANYVKYLKPIYNKPLITKLMSLWSSFKENNPVLGLVLPSFLLANSVLTGVLVYGICQMPESHIPRYYDSIVIFRPDDPRVKDIRKDDSLYYVKRQIVYKI